tara:strand:+ start:3664 stop:4599 length:936 start_codon:yes stop_codon:yes gene_type:complete
MIEIQNLSKNYGATKAVKSVNFSIKDGEIVGFLGANGAGKSTTLKILSGYLTPSHGKVTINNCDIIQDSTAIKKMIGYLPESNPLYNDMIVYDLLEFTANIRNIFGEEFKESLHRVVNQCGLKGVLHKNIGSCSKGYKQRIGLACAMIHDPKILILDEPVTGLDPNQIVEIRELIKNLGKEKLVLMSSHILQEIEATVDRIIIIDQGKIVADGSTKNLIKKHKGNIQLILEIKGATKEKIKLMSENVEDIKINKISKIKTGHRVEIEYSEKNDPREKIFKYIVKLKWTLLKMNPKSDSLEDIFRKLTGKNI